MQRFRGWFWSAGQGAALTLWLMLFTVGPVSALEIIIDNAPADTSDASRTFTGTWCTSGGTGPYGPDSLFSCGAGLDTYRWTPTIPTAGTYDVYVWWSSHPNRSTTVPITVTHAAGSTTQTFNEQNPGGAWVLHGQYAFNAGTAGFAEVNDGQGQAAADAVRFVLVATALPAVTVTASTGTGTEAGPSSGAFTVSRTGSTAATLTVTYTVGGTATPGSDYVALPGSVTIAAGQSAATIPVTPIDDTAVEPDETVILTLSADSAYTIGSPGSATVTIASNDVASEIVLDNLAAGAQDASRTFTGTWCASGGTGPYGPDSLFSCGTGLDTYRWTPTIPTAGTYDVYVWWSYHPMRSTSVPITVTHTAGSTTQTFNEQNPGGAWVLHGQYAFNAGTAGFVEVSDVNGQASADGVRFVLVAGSPNPVPSLASLSPSSGSAGGPAFTLTVNGGGFVAGSVVRWNGSDRPTTFVSASQVTAAISAADIAAAGGPSVTVFNPTPGGGLSNSLTFTINSTLPTVTITASTPTATEAGPSPGAFTVTRTGSTAAALTVNYTVGGTATPGSDYTALPGSVTIPSGSASAVIVLTPIDDPAVEPDETVILTLSASAAYTVGSPASATVTIVSNDVASEIVLDNLAAGAQDASRTFTGTWCASGGTGPYGPDSLFSCGTGLDTYRWTPTIPTAGTYDVYVWWSYHPMRSTSVPITVTHTAGSTTQTFNEQNPGGTWVLHGRYGFNTGTGGFVEVSDANGQAAADAARWVPVSSTPTATKLAITSVNGGANPTAGTPFAVTVTAQDSGGNAVNVATATAVSLSLKPGTGTGMLGGTVTGTIAASTSSGIVSGVTYPKAETGVVLTATRTSGDTLTPGDGAPFTVNAGAPSALAFTTQPGNASIGSPIPGPPTVSVMDALGNTVTSSTVAITVALSANPGSGTLGGTTMRNATLGVASFPDLTISAAGNGYALTATAAGGLTSSPSSPFNVAGPGMITGLVLRASDGRAIGGATVEALQGGTVRGTDVTGPDGTYALTGLSAGAYDARASADGYQPSTPSGVSVPAGGTATANFSLTANPSPSSISYLYDRLGRLVGVVDPAGETAVYHYDKVGNLLSIERRSSSMVSIVDFSPGVGPVGTPVRIYGTGFSTTVGQNTVKFTGVPASSVTPVTPTEMLATVPDGATTGKISVTVASSTATSATDFTVAGSPTGAPTISGFLPPIAMPGTSVTINGTNFDTVIANTKTKVNTTSVQPVSATPSSVGITVPAATGSGRIRVTTQGGTALSSADLFIPPAPYTLAQVELTDRMGFGAASSKTVTLSGGKIGLVVFDGVAGQRLTLQVTGVTTPTTVAIYSPSNTALPSMAVPTGATSLPLTLPATGTYTILVAPTSGPGSLTLTLGDVDLTALGVGIEGSPASVVSDGAGSWSFNVSWTVRNVGTVGTPPGAAWWDRIYLSVASEGTPADVKIAERRHTAGLAAGDAYPPTTWPASVPNTVAPGDYWVRLITDQENEIAESNELNNDRGSTARVALVRLLPDLQVTNVSGPGTPVQPNATDGTWRFTANWTVQNATAAAASSASWKDRIYVASAQSGGFELQVDEVTHTGGLGGTSNYMGSRDVTVPAFWSWPYVWLRVRTDADNQLSESDEGNNLGISNSQVTLAPKPDLIVSAVVGPSSAVTPLPDGRWMFTVEGTVYNVGQGPAPSSPSWVDRVYLSTQQTGTPTGPQIAEAPHTGGLAASDKYAGTLPATVPASTPAGTYWLVGWTDATQLLAEVDDSNNLGASQSQVILLARPDLEIVPPTWPSGNIARNPSDGTWSIPLLGAKVRNIGPTAASASVSWVDQAYISSVNTGTPDGPVIGTVPHSGGLAASGEYPIGGTGIVPSDVPPGLYWIVIKTDDLDQLVEENEGNNRVVSPTRVNLLP